MPATNMTEQQLRDWYARFSQEVLEKASIDVNRIEDVGRIKNYAIEEWGTLDNAEDYERAKVGHPTYAFMPHDGTKCLVQRPEYVPIDEHMKWLENNLRTGTDLGLEDIRNLYNMSRAGTLMINAPGKGPKFMQQVYTDETGNITTSKPVEEYSHEAAQNQLAGISWAGIQQFVTHPDPAQYTRPPEPVAPEQPENMHPGWLSWLGWKLGIKDTDYGKLMEYNKAKERYQERLTAWKNIDTAELTKNYEAALDRRRQFENEMKEFRTRNLAILHGVNGGYNTYALNKMFDDQEAVANIEPDKRYNTVMNQEDQRMKAWHDETPLGQLGTALQKVQANRDNIAKRTLKAAKSLMCFDQSDVTQWLEKGVYKRGEINTKSKTDPRRPEPRFVCAQGEKLSIDELRDKLQKLTPEQEREREAWQADMDVLAGLAGFCALAANENFGDLAASFFTVGHANSTHKIPYIGPARTKGLEAVAAWGDGEPLKLGQLFTMGLRALNQEVKKLGSLQDQHILGCMFMIDHLMKTMEIKTDIKDYVDLSEAEQKDIELNRAVFKAIYQGKEARTSLMEYAVHKKNMTPEELKQAALDILYEDYLTKMSLDGTVPDFVSEPELVEKVKINLISKYDLDKLATMERRDVGVLAESMVGFVKGLYSPQKAPVVDAEKTSHQLAGPEANNNELKVPEIKQPNIM